MAIFGNPLEYPLGWLLSQGGPTGLGKGLLAQISQMQGGGILGQDILPMISAAAGFMGGAFPGKTPYPQSFMQNLSRGLMGGVQGYQGAQEYGLNQQMRKMQIEKMKRQEKLSQKPVSEWLTPETKEVERVYEPGEAQPPWREDFKEKVPTGDYNFNLQQALQGASIEDLPSILGIGQLMEKEKGITYQKVGPEDTLIAVDKHGKTRVVREGTPSEIKNMTSEWKNFTKWKEIPGNEAKTFQDYMKMHANLKETEAPGLTELTQFESVTGYPKEKRGTPEYETAFLSFMQKKGLTRPFFTMPGIQMGSSGPEALILNQRTGQFAENQPLPGGKGMLPAQMPQELKDKQTALGQANDLISQLKGMWDKLPHKPGSTGRAYNAWMATQAMAGQNVEARTYINMVEGFLGNLSRSLGGERGVLTDQDIKRINKIMPQISKNPVASANKEEAEAAWNELDTILKNAETRLKKQSEATYGNVPSITKPTEAPAVNIPGVKNIRIVP